MKSEHLYQHLRDFTERLGISVLEQNLKSNLIRIRSGFCVVKGKSLFIMDKNRPIRDRIHILATWLVNHVPDKITDEFILPSVREVLERYRGK
jgi:hypothetical protein